MVKSSMLAGVGLMTRRLEGVDGDAKNKCFARRCTKSDLLRLEGRSAATFGVRSKVRTIAHKTCWTGLC